MNPKFEPSHLTKTEQGGWLLLDHPDPSDFKLGGEFTNDVSEALELINSKNYDVIALILKPNDQESLTNWKHLFQENSQKIRNSKIILVNAFENETNEKEANETGEDKKNETCKNEQNEKIDSNEVFFFSSRFEIFKTLNTLNSEKLGHAILLAKEEAQMERQDIELIKIAEVQNARLQKISEDFESRIEKRQRKLLKSKEKLDRTKSYAELLENCLVSVQRATRPIEIERFLSEILCRALHLQWIRLVVKPETWATVSEGLNIEKYEIFSTPLIKENEHLGDIYFSRAKNESFLKDENLFLLQVSEAAALAVDRLNQLDQVIRLRQQWEATFDAILKPVAIISSRYQIVRCNKSYADQTEYSAKELVGRRCHEVLFGEEKPCRLCKLGESFRLNPMTSKKHELHTYEVSTQKLQTREDTRDQYVVMYNDISQRLELERQMRESSKLAELGLIGSSIAHELNNPLGGIISFLQLIKMGLKGDERYFDDIIEMEKGAQNCKEIVQNLLAYARQSEENAITSFDLREVVERTLKIVEIESKLKNITWKTELSNESLTMNGHFNYLTQALHHLLQASMFLAKPGETKASNIVEMRIKVVKKNNNYLIEISNSSQVFKVDLSMSSSWSIKELSPSNDDEFTDKVSSSANEKTSNSSKMNYDDSTNQDMPFVVAQQIIREHAGTLEDFSQTVGPLLFRISLPINLTRKNSDSPSGSNE